MYWEAEHVRVYWETGRLIHAHVKQEKQRADYGLEVIKRLAEDLKIERTVLHTVVSGLLRNIPVPKLLPRGNNSPGAITAS